MKYLNYCEGIFLHNPFGDHTQTVFDGQFNFLPPATIFINGTIKTINH